jgi:proline iminopeptidase
MPSITAPDGLRLAYQVHGAGPEVLCLPGGPMQDSVYLGDLGGLAAGCRLVITDTRGTGRSEVPADLTTCRCDRLVDDVEAFRAQLGLDRLTLLGHSAGANVAVRYAEQYPDRTTRLLLIAPSTRAVGMESTVDQRRAIIRLRQHEPWYEETAAAFERVNGGAGTGDDWDALMPLFYGRWDGAAQAHAAAWESQTNEAAAAEFAADGAFDPPRTRAALASLDADVLLLAGELDVNTVPAAAAEYAALFQSCELIVQPGAGHLPWLDDPGWFRAAIVSFLEKTGA